MKTLDSAKRRILSAGLGVAVLLSWSACTTDPPEFPAADVVTGPTDDRIYIVDITGKRWDVTHAVEHYGFVASEFQHGVGPNAIRPINYPTMLSPGDPGYPDDAEIFSIIGTTIGGESRAYGIRALFFHEIVNESFADVDVHVAVAY